MDGRHRNGQKSPDSARQKQLIAAQSPGRRDAAYYKLGKNKVHVMKRKCCSDIGFPERAGFESKENHTLTSQ